MKKNADPLVSVIVVNYNGEKHLKVCLGSLKRTKYPNFEVILVDDGSTDKSISLVKRSFRWVKLVENKKNIGQVKGRIIGVQRSKGKYIAFLDNDTEVTPNWLSELVKAMESDSSIAGCTSKVLLYSNKQLINSAGMGCDVYGFAFSRGIICRSNFEEDAGQYDNREEVFGTYGASMLIRKDVLEKVGINPDLAMYYDDVDLSWRIRLAGYRIMYIPTSIVFHKMGGTKTRFTKKIKYYTERNRLSVMIQNYGLPMLMRVIPFYSLLKLSEFLLYLFFRKFDYAYGLAKGILSVAWSLPRIISERNHVQKKIRKVGDERIIERMEKHSIELSLFLKGYGRFVLTDSSSNL